MRHIICTVTNDLNFDQRMCRICGTLAQAGYNVTLVGRERRNSKPIENQSFKQVRLRCRFDHGKLFYLEYNLRLFWWLRGQKVDIINAVDLDTLVAGYVAARFRGIACVYDAHEYFTETPEVVGRKLVKSIWEAVARLIIPRLEYCYTVGDGLAALFSERYGVRFGVVRNVPILAPTEASNYTDLPKLPMLFYQGALNEGRGIEAAIEAMQYIEDAVLWLAGEGDLSASLREQVTRLGLGQRVRFLGMIAPDELRRLTPHAFVGLNLLENRGLSYYFSLANKAFDYIHAQVPCIQMAFPEYISLNEHHPTSLLLDNLEVSSIVNAIRTLLDDKHLYTTLQQNCNIIQPQVSWQHDGEILLQIYRSK